MPMHQTDPQIILLGLHRISPHGLAATLKNLKFSHKSQEKASGLAILNPNSHLTKSVWSCISLYPLDKNELSASPSLFIFWMVRPSVNYLISPFLMLLVFS